MEVQKVTAHGLASSQGQTEVAVVVVVAAVAAVAAAAAVEVVGIDCLWPATDMMC